METATDLLGRSERERILQATAELCAERGYGEINSEQVAGRADVPEEVFEDLFPGGVEEAFGAAVNTLLADTLSTVSAAYAQDRSEAESAMLGVLGILELMAAKRSLAYISFIGARQMGPEEALKVHDAGISLLTAMLERLWAYSDANVQPSRVAAAVLGGAEAVVRRELVAGRHDELPRLLPDLVFGATVAFLGQREAARLARESRGILAGTRWAEG